MPNPERCPPDPEETPEAYWLASLPADEAQAFEEHYVACPGCAAIPEETTRCVAAMNQAAQRLRDSGK